MNFEGDIRKLMEPLTIISSVDNGVRVSTHCLYPSNGTVSVVVRKHMDGYVVSDDGDAVANAVSAGLHITDADRKIRPVVHHQGLIVKNNIISSPRLPLEAVPAAILLVANGSKDAAEWLLTHIKFNIPKNFKLEVSNLLHRYFADSIKDDQSIFGASQKKYQFGHIAYLSGGRRLLVDAVTNDPNSINSRVVANMDVRMLHDEKIIQRMIYDDSTPWKSSDLRLLEIGATPLPFSRATGEISRLAA